MGNNCCVQEDTPAASSTYQVVPAEQERQFAGFSESFAADAPPPAPGPSLPNGSKTPTHAAPAPAETVEPSPGVDIARPILEGNAPKSSGMKLEEKKEPSPALASVPAGFPDDSEERLAITIVKGSMEDKLGVDLKHCTGYVLVKRILDGFLAAKHAAGGNGLKVGDKVVKINGVEGDTDQMVAACGESLSITFHLVRPKDLSQ
mmetsp:Transcript_54526/g.130044  ORF Transcript_54526/g.130044 Transcript_54526/m.130044 type:complete len:204 (-) Transcript_54526:166-777(-)